MFMFVALWAVEVLVFSRGGGGGEGCSPQCTAVTSPYVVGNASIHRR